MRKLKALFLAILLPLCVMESALAQCVIPGATTVPESTSFGPLAADTGKIFVANCTCTLTLPATPPTSVWRINLIVTGGTVTVSPNGANIDGSSSNETFIVGTTTLISTDGTSYYTSGNSLGKAFCLPGAFVAQTDAATVTWAVNSQMCQNASLTFTAHGGARTLNITNLATGGSYVLWLKQDGTGGEGLTLGTGCTWKVSGGGTGAITPSTSANVIDVLAFTYDGTNCYANFNKNFN
jgi:hypothetical protein